VSSARRRRAPRPGLREQRLHAGLAQAEREVLPAPLHALVQPGIFQRLGQVGRVRAGLQHARCQRADEEVEVVAQRVFGQQRGDVARALAPSRGGELQRHQQLQALHAVDRPHASRRQHRQGQPGGLVQGQGGDEGAQHRQPPPGGRIQPGHGLAAEFGQACVAHGLQQVHAFARLRGQAADHRQIAGHIAGVRVEAFDDRRGRVGGRAAQRPAQHGAARDVDPGQVLRRHLPGVEADAGAPGLQPQLQPLPRRAVGAGRAAAEHSASGHPALAHRRAGVQQRRRRHEAVAGVIPADVEAGAIGDVGGRGGELEGGLVHRRLRWHRRPLARGMETVSELSSSWRELARRRSAGPPFDTASTGGCEASLRAMRRALTPGAVFSPFGPAMKPAHPRPAEAEAVPGQGPRRAGYNARLRMNGPALGSSCTPV